MLEGISWLFFLFCSANISVTPFRHWHLRFLIETPLNTAIAYFQIVLYVLFVVLLLPRIIFFLRYYFFDCFRDSFRKNPYVWILAILSLISCLWSETPWVTLKAGCILLSVNLTCLYVSVRYSDMKIFRAIQFNGAVIIFMSLLNGRQAQGGLTGVLSSKNSLGGASALMAILWYVSFIYIKERRFLSLFMAAIAVGTVILAASAGGLFILTSLFALIFILQLIKHLRFQYAVLASISSILLLSVVGIFIQINLESILAAVGKDLSFTGRVPLWSEIWKAVQVKLWLGYGSYGFWQYWRGLDNPAGQLVVSWKPPHAHMGFLDVWVDLGLVGFVLMVLSLIASMLQALKLLVAKQGITSMLPFMFLTYVILSNLSESRFLRPGFIWFIYCIVAIKLTSLDSVGCKNRFSNFNVDFIQSHRVSRPGLK